MKRKLFGTNELLDDFKKGLTKVKELDGGWTKVYRDKDTDEEWVEYVINPDRGCFRNLMLISPRPNTDELIRIALESNFDDEVYASSVRLYLDEQLEGLEYRQKLVDKILSLDLYEMTGKDKERIGTIIKSARLDSEFNHRNVLGKHVSEINKDWEFFKEIAYKSKQILAQIKL